MQDSQTPPKFLLPWAASAGGGYINTVPVPSQIGITNGAASFTDGFPPLTFVALSAGGAGPFGKDFNGIFKQLTQGAQWGQAGGPYFYDSAFSTAIGGYPKGAMISSLATLGQFWLSTVENNTTNPDTGGGGWIALLIRPTITAATNYYVATTGSDSNPGTSALPWATLQKAWDYLTSIDLQGLSVVINVADGTYAPLNAYSVISGQASVGAVTFQGNIVTPSACTISATNDDAILAIGARFAVRGFRVTATGTAANQGAGIECLSGATVIFDTMDFGVCARSHMTAGSNSTIGGFSGWTISGGSQFHIAADLNGVASIEEGAAVTLSGTPAFTGSFALAFRGGLISIGTTANGVIFSGSATGNRVAASLGGGIDVSGTVGDYLPGNADGTIDAATFAWYNGTL